MKAIVCLLLVAVILACIVYQQRIEIRALEAKVASIQADLRRMEVRRVDGFKVDGVPSPVWLLTWKVVEASPAPPPATQPALTPEVEEVGK